MDRSASNRIAYKIMAVGETDQLRWNGKFQGSAAGLADAFIHMSTAMQLPATIEGSLPGPRQPHARGDHVASLGGALRWEPSRGRHLFQHLYGTLSVNAVVAMRPLEPAADGSVKLPG